MKRLLEQVLSYLPTALPHGMEEFNEWSRSIISLSRAPDNESTRFAVAVMILHMEAGEDTKAKRWFVKKLNKAACNELANGIAMQIKEAQKARVEQEARDKSAVEAARDILPA